MNLKILNKVYDEVANSTWQPEFEFTDNLDTVVDSILKPHEDYFLGLHSKVKEIIEREINYAKVTSNYQITFADVCNWQKELFEHKKQVINNNYYSCSKNSDFIELQNKLDNLPNKHINLGLRQISVKVNNWTPPATMFLEELKMVCFPIDLKNGFLLMGIKGTNTFIDEYTKELITEWYKLFETIHFFEDLNGRLGGIIINIISYITRGKYLIKL